MRFSVTPVATLFLAAIAVASPAAYADAGQAPAFPAAAPEAAAPAVGQLPIPHELLGQIAPLLKDLSGTKSDADAQEIIDKLIPLGGDIIQFLIKTGGQATATILQSIIKGVAGSLA